MLEILDYSDFTRQSDLSETVFQDRAAQFVHRHKWPLKVTANGYEIDDFDADGTRYLVVHRHGVHRASLRLRPAAAGSMVERAFPEIWRDHGAALAGLVEVTRFCSARHLDGIDRRRSTIELLIGLCRHGRRNGTTGLFGVVYPGVTRAIARSGWACQVLGRYVIDDREVWLARWDCTPEADWALQEQSAALADRAEARLAAEGFAAA